VKSKIGWRGVSEFQRRIPFELLKVKVEKNFFGHLIQLGLGEGRGSRPRQLAKVAFL
jgi:hypothetical protein